MSEHNHAHSHNDMTQEELLALIKYMASHNASHTAELDNLVKKLDFASEDTKAVINNAIEKYQAGNELLNKAISMLEGE